MFWPRKGPTGPFRGQSRLDMFWGALARARRAGRALPPCCARGQNKLDMSSLLWGGLCMQRPPQNKGALCSNPLRVPPWGTPRARGWGGPASRGDDTRGHLPRGGDPKEKHA